MKSHIVLTIDPWPNTKQWLMNQTSYFIMITRSSTCILTIIATREKLLSWTMTDIFQFSKYINQWSTEGYIYACCKNSVYNIKNKASIYPTMLKQIGIVQWIFPPWTNPLILVCVTQWDRRNVEQPCLMHLYSRRTVGCLIKYSSHKKCIPYFDRN